MFHLEALSLLGRVLLCLVVTFLPCFAVCAFAIRKGALNAIWLSLLALVQIGLVGYFAFWLWFAMPWLGHAFSFCLPVASAIYLAAILRTLRPNQKKLLCRLFTPIALTGISAMIVLSAGFLYGGSDDPLQAAQARFSHPLAGDNWIPYRFATAIEKHVDRPRFGDWLSSDRPPLQSGIYLSEFGYVRGQKGYEVLSAILQSLWIYALYVLLLSFHVRLRVVRPILITCLLSGFVFLNTFFVWPKLFAAAYLLAFSAVALSPGLLDARSSSSKAVLSGALLAFGLLSHGGVIFSALGLMVILFFLRFRAVFSRTTIVIVLACFCLYLPWMLYQKLYDPPGDRLLKWHLAGMIAPNSLSFGHAISQAYHDLPSAQIVNNKLSNFNTVYNHPVDYWLHVRSLVSSELGSAHNSRVAFQIAHDLRGTMFFYFVPSLGFLMFGPFALLAGLWRRYRLMEWKAAIILYACVFFTLVLWCLIMFGPASTVVHQGSYAANVMAMAGAILAFYVISPWLAWVLACAEIALNFFLYGPLMDTAGPIQSVQLDMLSLLLVSLAAMAFLLSRLRPAADVMNFEPAARNVDAVKLRQ